MELGLDPSLFWGLTLREITLMMEGAAERERRAYNDRAGLAWTGAALARAKRLPKLKTLLIPGRRVAPRPQTAQEQLAIFRQWAAVTASPARKR